jgi:intracellular sulfur oxidation DsrE/DsrF family protein
MMTRKQILNYLERDGWSLVCESPFEMEKYVSGFVNSRFIQSWGEAEEEVQALVHSKALYKALHKKEQDKKKKQKEIATLGLENCVKNLIKKGITEDTLLDFYLLSCNFGHRFNPSERCLRDCFKDALKGK